MEENLTLWLGRLTEGDAAALDHVMRVLYDEIRFLARQRLSSERSDHTLAPTALDERAAKVVEQRFYAGLFEERRRWPI